MDVRWGHMVQDSRRERIVPSTRPDTDPRRRSRAYALVCAAPHDTMRQRIIVPPTGWRMLKRPPVGVDGSTTDLEITVMPVSTGSAAVMAKSRHLPGRTDRLSVDRPLVVAWVLTVARIPLLFACVYFLLTDAHPFLPIAVLIAIVVADILDGQVLERSCSCTREMRIRRHIFDVIGDRIVILTIAVTALCVGKLAPAICAVLIAREVLLSFIVVRPLLASSTVLATDNVSRLAAALIAPIVIASFFQSAIPFLLVIPFALLSAVGMYRYAFCPRAL